MSYAKALKRAQCEGGKATIRKRRLLFSGAVQRAKPELLTRRMMFGTMAGGENLGPGRPRKSWARCPVTTSRRLEQRGIDGNLPFVVQGRYGAMAYGG